MNEFNLGLMGLQLIGLQLLSDTKVTLGSALVGPRDMVTGPPTTRGPTKSAPE